MKVDKLVKLIYRMTPDDFERLRDTRESIISKAEFAECVICKRFGKQNFVRISLLNDSFWIIPNISSRLPACFMCNKCSGDAESIRIKLLADQRVADIFEASKIINQ